MKTYYIYILSNKRNGTLYIGMTHDLVARTYQHKREYVEGFTKRYHIHNLVYFEGYQSVNDAITRERQLKKWNRAWKLTPINERNPYWKDLYDGLK